MRLMNKIARLMKCSAVAAKAMHVIKAVSAM
jgi:hypothetical protein